MDDEQKYEFSLRDKFALEIFKLIIQHNHSYSRDVLGDYEKHCDKPEDKKLTQEAYDTLARKMQAAYNLADLMRKVRLGVFT